MLLNDTLAPITSEIGFLEVDNERAAEAFLAWQAPLRTSRRIKLTRRPVSGTLETVLQALLPLTSVERRRYLFVPTGSSWTAFFDNGYRGTDAMSAMSVLAKRVGCRGLRVVSVPHTLRRESKTARGRWGATILEVYGPEDTHFLNYVRTICAANDGGPWVFHETGVPFPFEDLEAYRRKPIRERFSPELLRRYLAELGLRAFEADFYLPPDKGPAQLIEMQGPRAPDSVEYSLEQARADF